MWLAFTLNSKAITSKKLLRLPSNHTPLHQYNTLLSSQTIACSLFLNYSQFFPSYFLRIQRQSEENILNSYPHSYQTTSICTLSFFYNRLINVAKNKNHIFHCALSPSQGHCSAAFCFWTITYFPSLLDHSHQHSRVL